MKTGATFLTIIAVGLVALMENLSYRPVIGRTDEAAANRMVNYQCFKVTLQAALKDLRDDKLSLAEATARVHRAASVYWSIYLIRLEHIEGGKTCRENVARNLVGHLCEELGMTARTKALRIELQGLLNTDSAQGRNSQGRQRANPGCHLAHPGT